MRGKMQAGEHSVRRPGIDFAPLAPNLARIPSIFAGRGFIGIDPVPDSNHSVLQFLKARRSVPAKALGEPGPDKQTVRAMLEIASRVPDHGKIAPWRFIIYGKPAVAKLNKLVLERADSLNGPLSEDQRQVESSRFSRAPIVVGLISCPKQHPKVPEWEQVLSAGAVGMNLINAANAFGYDAQWITEWIAFDSVLAPHLGLNEGERFAGFFHIGTRTLPKTERERPQLDQIVTYMES